MAAGRIGFRKARQRLCEALRNPRTIVHEPRTDQAKKNLLANGVVTCAEVLAVARAANGTDYKEDAHDQDASIVVHIIRRAHQGIDWYIKWYCIEPNVTFISVHH